MKNAHTEHCCKKCGCKYGEDVEEFLTEESLDKMIYPESPFVPCDVVAGRLPQSFPCGQNGVCNGY